MNVSQNCIYLLALIPFSIIWAYLFLKRKDLRREIIIMSLIIGFLSVATSYYWWTLDWWKPLTITGTKVGIEDFVMGFTAGGIMATIYEVVFKKKFYKRRLHHHISGGLTIILLLAQTTMWLMWGIGLTSFVASTIAMIFVGICILVIRKDLILNAVISGLLMMIISSLFYFVILALSSDWINATYLSGLTGIRPIGIPVEEFIFWFLAGFVFGPFYEYWQGEKLRSLR